MDHFDVLAQLKIDARLVGEPSLGDVLDQAKWAAAARITACALPLVDLCRGGGAGAEGELVAAFERAVQKWPVQS